MVYTVGQEVQKQEDRLVGQLLVDVEQESMHAVLQHGPDDVSNDKADSSLDVRRLRHDFEKAQGQRRLCEEGEELHA